MLQTIDRDQIDSFMEWDRQLQKFRLMIAGNTDTFLEFKTEPDIWTNSTQFGAVLLKECADLREWVVTCKVLMGIRINTVRDL